jgi:hypothetical protein
MAWGFHNHFYGLGILEFHFLNHNLYFHSRGHSFGRLEKHVLLVRYFKARGLKTAMFEKRELLKSLAVPRAVKSAR